MAAPMLRLTRATAARWALRLIAVLMLLATAAVLLGCGGGDPEPEPAPDLIGPPDCHSHPEVCK